MHKTTKKKILLMTLLAMAIFSIMFIHNSTVQSFILYAVSPLIDKSTQGKERVGALLSVFKSQKELITTIHELENKNKTLTIEKSNFQVCLQKNKQLHETLDIPLQKTLEDYTLQGANIIGYNSGEQKEWIIIDRGTKDDIKEGNVIVTRDGLFVGITSEIKSHTAHVALVTNTNSIIRAYSSTQRTTGIIRGHSGLGASFSLVDNTHVLNEGEIIVTVENMTIPEGLVIGTIQGIHTSKDKLFQEATIIPSYSPKLSHTLFVLKNRL